VLNPATAPKNCFAFTPGAGVYDIPDGEGFSISWTDVLGYDSEGEIYNVFINDEDTPDAILNYG